MTRVLKLYQYFVILIPQGIKFIPQGLLLVITMLCRLTDSRVRLSYKYNTSQVRLTQLISRSNRLQHLSDCIKKKNLLRTHRAKHKHNLSSYDMAVITDLPLLRTQVTIRNSRNIKFRSPQAAILCKSKKMSVKHVYRRGAIRNSNVMAVMSDSSMLLDTCAALTVY